MTIHTFSDEQLAGQRLMVGFEGREFNENLRELIGRLYVGGLILFSQNIAEPDQLQRLCRDCQGAAQGRQGQGERDHQQDQLVDFLLRGEQNGTREIIVRT